MKRLMIIMLMTTVCSTSMAGISSGSHNSWYDDLLEFLNLHRDRDVSLDDTNIYNDTPAVSYTDDSQSYPSKINSDIDVDLDDLPLTESEGASDGIIDPGQNAVDNPDSHVIANPEPCSIILSSIGLGIAGYLKRRRAI
ncbi:MAG: hypothetical protein K9M75_11145 [Phycisphaerae bacterium]|nr:hypothetical protein [Phycisphaerae bacterium]